MGRRTLVLVIAIILAVVAAFAVYQYLSSVRDTERQNVAEVGVFRASEFIEIATEGETAKTVITESTAIRETVVFDGSTIICTGPTGVNADDDPTEFGCPNNPKSLDEALNGKVAAGPISAGQLITTEQWVSAAELADVRLSESLEQGKVAIALRPDEVGAVGGFVRPGDHVNMIASASVPLNQFLGILQNPDLRELILGSEFAQAPAAPTPPTGGGDTGDETGQEGEEEEFDPVTSLAETLPAQLDFTQTFLQDIEIIAVGPDTKPAPLGTGLTPQGSQVIVVQVTPEEAEKIEYTRQYTSVGLMLLPDGLPYAPFDSRGVLIDDIFDLVDRIQESVEELLGTSGS